MKNKKEVQAKARQERKVKQKTSKILLYNEIKQKKQNILPF